MLRNRALIRSTALAAILTATSFALASTAGADAAVALVGANASQGTAVQATVIPEVIRTDGSGRTSYAFTDATGTPVAPPVEAEAQPLDAHLAVGFLPAAEIPASAAASNLSTIVLLVGLALLALGSTVLVSGCWHRVVPATRSAAGRLTVRTAHGTRLLAIA